jgi:glycosyltransferase involved in cell wall biosynthesis
MRDVLHLTVLMPCLNEAETLATCIRKAHAGAQSSAAAASYEILVADNGSTDVSQQIAEHEGARVVHVAQRGYGAALKGGIDSARGRLIVMADSDDSYDFSQIAPFVDALGDGYALVMGTRLRGEILPGAMPWLHRYLGNPALTLMGNALFGAGFSDFHCGMRGFQREAILALNLSTTGMEFATEMLVKAARANLRRTEIPVTLSPDGRSRPPHLQTWRDGWRHFLYMLNQRVRPTL